MMNLLLSSVSASAILASNPSFAEPMDLNLARTYVAVQQFSPTTMYLKQSRGYVAVQQYPPTYMYVKHARAYVIVKPN